MEMMLYKLHVSCFVLVYQVAVFLLFPIKIFSYIYHGSERKTQCSKLIAISRLGRGVGEHDFTKAVAGNISVYLLPFPDHQAKLMLVIFCSQTCSGLIFMEAMAEVVHDGFLLFGFGFE